MTKRIFFYLIPAVLLVTLMYVVVHFFFPPRIGAPEEAAAKTMDECAPGETRQCITDEGCRGHMPCQLGRLGECVPDYECRPGEIENCPYDVCTVGQRECNECGRWGPCTLNPGCGLGDYCPAENNSA